MTTKALIGQLQFNAASTSTPLDSLRWNTLVLLLQASDAIEFYVNEDLEAGPNAELITALDKSYDTLINLYAELEAAGR